MPWLLAIVGVFVAWNADEGALRLLVGASLGALVGVVIDLHRRVRTLSRALEQARSPRAATTAPPPAPAASDPVQPEAPATDAAPPRAPSGAADTPVRPSGEASRAADAGNGGAGEPKRGTGYLRQRLPRIRDVLIGDNPLVRVGIVVLFFGVAFVLKYASDQGALPLSLRLAAVAVGGVAMMAVGWWLRGRRRQYALVLQGGGVGILYLTLFAAARLYAMLPMAPAFAGMVAVCALGMGLAMVQRGAALAVFASIGGFLAPVLASTGTGSHVGLFGYYAVLNLGILAVAWYRAWRALNLVGFVFTFGIGLAWGAGYYQPRFFASTEPFLAGFFLLYLAVAVLFALRQPPRLRGLVDGTLVFGLPVAAFGLQTGLVYRFEYGLAVSAVALASVYALTAAGLWRRHGLAVLAGAFAVIAAAFATVAVPLAVDGHWTGGAWALEAAGLIWVGLRQGQAGSRWSGLALLGMAAVMLVAEGAPGWNAPAFVNAAAFGGILLAIGAVLSAWWLHRWRDALAFHETVFGYVALAGGTLAWCAVGLLELGRLLDGTDAVAAVAVWLAVSGVAGGAAALRLRWPSAATAAAGIWPLMALGGTATAAFEGHVLVAWAIIPWAVLFIGGSTLLRWLSSLWPEPAVRGAHIVQAWMVLGVSVIECQWLARQWLQLAQPWSGVAAVLPLVGAGAGILAWQRSASASVLVGLYRDAVAVPAAMLAATWAIAAVRFDGAWAMGYWPLLNPLAVVQGSAFAVACWAFATLRQRGTHWPVPSRAGVWAGGGGALLLLVTVELARAVHHWAAVAYVPAGLFGSAVFQAGVSVLWSVAALLAMVGGTRTGQRRPWLAGAALLAVVLVKLFVVDLAGIATLARIVSFLGVGVLTLVTGYLCPLPPRASRVSEPPAA